MVREIQEGPNEGLCVCDRCGGCEAELEEPCSMRLKKQLDEVKSQVNDLNNLLRHAGWGQGEIDSASSLVMELDDSNSKCDRLAAELAEAVCGETEMDELVRLRAALKHIAEYDEAPIWNDSRDDAAKDMLGIARRAIGINSED